MTTGDVEAAPVDEAVVCDLVARVLAGFILMQRVQAKLSRR